MLLLMDRALSLPVEFSFPWSREFHDPLNPRRVIVLKIIGHSKDWHIPFWVILSKDHCCLSSPEISMNKGDRNGVCTKPYTNPSSSRIGTVYLWRIKLARKQYFCFMKKFKVVKLVLVPVWKLFLPHPRWDPKPLGYWLFLTKILSELIYFYEICCFEQNILFWQEKNVLSKDFDQL